MNFQNIFLILIIASVSCCFFGCFQWAARAENKLPEKTALHKSYDYDGKVIIVGAGASGLAAAKVLEQNNIDYIILEATNRYGGRLKKDTTLADFPIDIGAEWLHSSPLVLNKLKGKNGNEIDESLIPYKLENTATWDGKNYITNPKWQDNFRYNFLPESKFKSATWYDFVNENIAEEVKHKINYNSIVTGINYSGNKVIVKTENGKTHQADRVLVTVSIGILKSNMITFIPEMNKEKKQAIASITFLPGIKVAMKFSQKFYPDAIGCTVDSGEKVYYDIAFKKNSQDNILGFLWVGEEIQNYIKLKSEQEIIDSLLEELDQMFDGKASSSYTGNYILENWGQHEFTQGTWVQAFQEKKSHLKELNKPLHKKVYFAGEIYDTYKQMGVPGAILSGYYAADKILTDK